MTKRKPKRFFLSYGRRETLLLAALIHQALKIKGYDGWFDKVKIPDGMTTHNALTMALNLPIIFSTLWHRGV